MRKLLQLSRWIDRANDRVGYLVTLLVPLMLLLGVWNVVGRYVGRLVGQNLSSNAFIEGQWYIFSLIFLLGAAYTLRHNDHVRVDVLYSNRSPRQKAIVNLLGSLLFLIPFCLMVMGASWSSIMASWARGEISPDPGGLPRYPIKSAILICCTLLSLQGLSEAIKSWAILNRPNAEEPPHGD
ncbi:TRAP transporter small permease subunit [Acaryochloris thomasi]|uniref:TRAP transporter small permease subunit n=1 Tax=Acaryochloris thomasi TaxID=2929456 RepID=UPI000DA6AC96|nr:TRAP transporter small permease subunit [Acaryochloris thomasi]